MNLELQVKLNRDPVALAAWNRVMIKLNTMKPQDFYNELIAWEYDTADFITMKTKEFVELRNDVFYVREHLHLAGIDELTINLMIDCLTEIVDTLRQANDDGESDVVES